MNVCEGALPDVSDVVVGGLPVDLSAAALSGLWFNMKECSAVNALLISAIGTAGDDPVINLRQATNNAGAGAKTLNIHRLDYKVGATGFTSASDLWQRVTSIDPDNPAASYDTDGINGAENGLLLSAFILATDLDINQGFTHIQLQVADVGTNAQLGCILYIPSQRHYQGKHRVSALA